MNDGFAAPVVKVLLWGGAIPRGEAHSLPGVQLATVLGIASRLWQYGYKIKHPSLKKLSLYGVENVTMKKNGFRYTCAKCNKAAQARRGEAKVAYDRQWAKDNPAKTRAKHRRYYWKNREKRLAQWHVCEAKRRAKDPSRLASTLARLKTWKEEHARRVAAASRRPAVGE